MHNVRTTTFCVHFPDPFIWLWWPFGDYIKLVLVRVLNFDSKFGCKVKMHSNGGNIFLESWKFLREISGKTQGILFLGNCGNPGRSMQNHVLPPRP